MTESTMASLSEQERFLLEMRDSNLSRFLQYDRSSLTLLFGIAAAWGATKSIDPEFSELIELILSLGGFIVTISWSARRKLLWRLDDEILSALKTSESLAAQLAVSHEDLGTSRLAMLRAKSIRYGEWAAVIIFAGLTLLSIWTLISADLCAGS